MKRLKDDAKDDDFLPSSVIVAYAIDQERWNMFIKVGVDWVLVSERGPSPTKVRFQDIITGSIFPLNHGGLWVLYKHTMKGRDNYASLRRDTWENTIL